MTQCETLDDVKLNLSETDYGDALADMGTLIPTGLQKAAVEKVSFFMWGDESFVGRLSWVHLAGSKQQLSNCSLMRRTSTNKHESHGIIREGGSGSKDVLILWPESTTNLCT